VKLCESEIGDGKFHENIGETWYSKISFERNYLNCSDIFCGRMFDGVKHEYNTVDTDLMTSVNVLYFRFSLLGLEPGEIYFQDFSVVYYPIRAEWSEQDSIQR
jgi:hypothetical protein